MYLFWLKTQFQQAPQQFIVQQSPGQNKTTILNQNVVFINQSGQQQIIASNQQQGNNVGEWTSKRNFKNNQFSRYFYLKFLNIFFSFNSTTTTTTKKHHITTAHGRCKFLLEIKRKKIVLLCMLKWMVWLVKLNSPISFFIHSKFRVSKFWFTHRCSNRHRINYYNHRR